MNGTFLTLGGVSALAAASAWSKEPQRLSPVVMLSAVSAGALLLSLRVGSSGRKDAFGIGSQLSEYAIYTPETPKWRRRVIERTSEHEGGPDSINENTDGAGISYGIIQWTQRSGNLYGLLSFLQEKHPAEFARHFGPNSKALLDHAKAGESRLSSSLSDGTSSGRLWEEPWYSRFQAAGRDPKLAAAQVEYAEYYDHHMVGAVDTARRLNLWTERAISLFYDRAVQQGVGAAREITDAVLAKWSKKGRPDYRQQLLDFAGAAADRYRSPVYKTSTSKTGEWRKVGNEYHWFKSGKDRVVRTWDRANNILNDRSLSDQPIPEHQRVA